VDGQIDLALSVQVIGGKLVARVDGQGGGRSAL